MTTSNKRVKVWDPVVRLGHWTLVVSFFIAYFTEEDLLDLHVWAGYVAGSVVAVRLAWGFIGTRYARFSDFVYSPREVIAYLRGLRNRNAPHYLGHNPAGGFMILALIIGLIASAYSGLMIYGIEDNAGPLASWAAGSSEDLWEELHEIAANLTLVLVLFHIGGVVLSSLSHRENLIKAMFTGYKIRPNVEPQNRRESE